MSPRDPICPFCSRPVEPGQSAMREDGKVVHIHCYLKAHEKDRKRQG
ncbi:MAG TPA: hypothetical protein VGW35_26830 [Methylomirabilota bacterium]|jgi:ribosomal protein L24E|nr:hypothetical protein [Methylomirabilota bacterium]